MPHLICSWRSMFWWWFWCRAALLVETDVSKKHILSFFRVLILHWVKRITEWRPTAIRKISRPQLRWEDDVRVYVGKMKTKNWSKIAMIWHDMIFIYSNCVLTRWQRSVNLYKNRKETAVYRRRNNTQNNTETQNIQNIKQTHKTKNKHNRNIKTRKSGG